ncbi:MAG: hypothetical protein KIS94_03310 [Chitinophagales bacterium]|nr:hypothetical protein [Chitinophagales bacterium]
MSTYYKPSGIAPVNSILTLAIGGGIAAVALSIVYIALQWFIPIIYLNLLITVGFGFGLYLALAYLVKLGKIRNQGIAAGVALFAALVGMYSQWALFISLMERVDGNVLYFVKTSFSLDNYMAVFTDPLRLFSEAKILNDIGTFSIKSATVSGIVLWMVWIIEAAMIIGIPVYFTYIHAGNPFSEKNNTWMDESTFDVKLKYIEDTAAFKSAVESGDYAVINNLVGNEAQDRFSSITGYRSEGDENMFLTFTNHLITTNKKGEAEEKKDTVVQYLRTDEGLLKQLVG